MPEKLLSFLGLCQRAGQIVPGMESCLKLLPRGGLGLVLWDETLAEDAHHKLQSACETAKIPFFCLPSNCLGQAVGKPGWKVVGLKPGSMAERAAAFFL